eukprot:3603760-Rhodomonas_salina.3
MRVEPSSSGFCSTSASDNVHSAMDPDAIGACFHVVEVLYQSIAQYKRVSAARILAVQLLSTTSAVAVLQQHRAVEHVSAAHVLTVQHMSAPGVFRRRGLESATSSALPASPEDDDDDDEEEEEEEEADEEEEGGRKRRMAHSHTTSALLLQLLLLALSVSYSLTHPPTLTHSRHIHTSPHSHRTHARRADKAVSAHTARAQERAELTRMAFAALTRIALAESRRRDRLEPHRRQHRTSHSGSVGQEARKLPVAHHHHQLQVGFGARQLVAHAAVSVLGIAAQALRKKFAWDSASILVTLSWQIRGTHPLIERFFSPGSSRRYVSVDRRISLAQIYTWDRREVVLKLVAVLPCGILPS